MIEKQDKKSFEQNIFIDNSDKKNNIVSIDVAKMKQQNPSEYIIKCVCSLNDYDQIVGKSILTPIKTNKFLKNAPFNYTLVNIFNY